MQNERNFMFDPKEDDHPYIPVGDQAQLQGQHSEKGISVAKVILVFLAITFSSGVLYSASKGVFIPTSILFDPADMIGEGDVVVDCGATRAEAISQGCKLDVMAATWLPPACYNATSAAEVTQTNTDLALLGGAGIFDWALDHNHSMTISQDQLWSLDSLTAHTYVEYHSAHCMYIWHLASRAWEAVLNGKDSVYIPSKAVDFEHTQHCRKVVAAGPKAQSWVPRLSVQVFFGLGACTKWDPTKGTTFGTPFHRDRRPDPS